MVSTGRAKGAASYIAAAGIALLLLGASSAPPESVQPKPQGAQASAQSPAPKDDPHETGRQGIAGVWHRTAEDPVALFTFVLAGFTGVLTIATILLWLETKGAINESRKASERQLRAYVGVVGSEVRNLDGDKPIEVEIKFRNAGQTPAHKLNVKGGCILSPYPGTPVFKDLSHHVYAPKSVPPGGEVLKRETAPLPPDRWASLIAGTDTLYVFGTVTYEDVFGAEHRTRYRLQVGGRQKLALTKRRGKTVALLAPAEEGNDSD